MVERRLLDAVVLDHGLNAKSPVSSDDDVHLCIGDGSLRLIGQGSLTVGIWFILNSFYVFVP